MLEFFVIPPLQHLELMNEGDRFFCLAQHYLKSEEYRQFFKQKVAEGAWVLLDNGIGDHSPVVQDDLFDIMIDLQPSEVIPVDTLFNAEETLYNLDLFITRMEKEGLLGKIQVLAVPQGQTKDEWIDCYKRMLYNIHVDTIGMSKLSVPWCFMKAKDDTLISEARHIAYLYLEKNNLLKKPIHLLGMGDPREMEFYKGDSLMRSTDSCYTILSAVNDINFSEGNFKRIPTPRDYFDRRLTDTQKSLALANIGWFRNFLK